jgi:hypothetical protein
MLLAVAGWLGYLLDDFLGLGIPVFMILFIIGSFGGFIYHLYRSFK